MSHRLFLLALASVLAMSLVHSTLAQSRQAVPLQKIGPQLQTLFPGDDAAGKRIDPQTAEVQSIDQTISAEGSKTAGTDRGGEPRYGVVVYTEDPSALRQAGISYGSGTDEFVTARLTRREIRAVAGLAAVEGVRAAGVATSHNDVVAGITGARILNNGRLANTNYTGTGVLTCVIDSGIDWSHRDFRGLGSNDTQSRILYLWDHTLTAESDEQTPGDRRSFSNGSYDYGVEYSRADIEDEIDGSPAGQVRSEDTDGHGTHVAGTIAGNGGAHPEQKYRGMAPEAELIVVKAGNGRFPFTNVIDGMNYCGEVATAQGKPLVVNMSLGSNSGPHDGTTFQDEAVESFVDGASGRAVVTSAGNSGGSSIHTQGTIPANGGASSITINVPVSVSEGEFRADLWLDDDSDVSVSVESPNGAVTSASPGEVVTDSTGDGEVYLFNWTYSSVGGGDRRLYIGVDDDKEQPPAQGDWTVTLTNASASPVGFHAWLFDNAVTSGVSAYVVGGDGAYTIGSPGSSPGAITVGASVHRWRWMSAEQGARYYCGTGACDGYPNRSDNIARFSSRGPLREKPTGVRKPNLTAPGQGTASTLSSQAGISTSGSRVLPDEKHWILKGTSMAAPAVAGTVALLFQENPSLAPSAVKSTLEGGADGDSYTGSVPNATWGYGRLNAVRAMTQLLDPGGQAHQLIYAYDGWGNVGSRNVLGNEKISVQFTPTADGVVSGFLLHPSQTVNLSGNLIVEVWTDDGAGYPGSKIGAAQSLDAARLQAYSWNYLDITDADASVQAGTDYHLVLSFENGADNMYIRVGEGSPSDRSNRYSSGFWSTMTSFDYRMRPVVSKSTASGQLPVELTSIQARRNEDTVVLSWRTASETNNAGFAIQRRRAATSSWKQLGFVDGRGTTSEPQRYSFEDADIPFGADSLTYRLKQVDWDGAFEYSSDVEVALNAPGQMALHAPFPNPTGKRATVRYEVPSAGHVQVTVYDMLGRRVATLVRQEQVPGRYETTFEANRLASGVYFLRLATDQGIQTQKITIVR